MSGVSLQDIHERIKTTGNEIAPYRNICWVLGGLFMLWAYARDWLFPVVAFIVVGGQILWPIIVLVSALRRPHGAEHQPPEERKPAPEPNPHASQAEQHHTSTDSLAVLIGTWNVFVNAATYGARWTFSDNYLVTSTAGTPQGKWRVDGQEIRIDWNERHYETFRLPLNEDGTPGDSWQGKAMVRAIKCRAETLPDVDACVGRWRVTVNSGKPETFTIELQAGGDAVRNPSKNVSHATARWKFQNGVVAIPWPDGWTDVLRPGTLGLEKAAFHGGKRNPEDITFAVKEA